MQVEVTREALLAMRDAARSEAPQEACGILLGEAARIRAFVSALNVHPDPATHFEIDPQTLIDAHRAARDGAAQVLGYFHSHPIGPAEPSAIDQASSGRDGAIWAIGAGGNTDFHVRFWKDEPQGFLPLSYEVSGG